ncbi:MAG TPA: CDP-alcohol phosphatidyltransferase family protein [Pseudolabrys sp.]|nr:CDP-alcohol phosphatidyltransferase family protein [Pseudolabrys sp.]
MQQGSHSVAPSPPVLVLLPDAGASPIAPAFADGGEPKVLGLGLVRRTVTAAGRAGYSRIYLLARDRAAPAGITAISNWSSLADACAMQPGPLIIAHAGILAEPDWLAHLAETKPEPARWAATPHKMILLAASVAGDALAVLEADKGAKGAYDLIAAQERLTQHFGTPAAIPAAINPLVVRTPADVDDAEWRLLRGLVKDTDGFMARNVERPISLRIARRLASTGITPNQVTLLSVGIGLCGALFFLSAHWLWQTIGALLFLAHSILDGCDGELARLRFQESRFGGIIDYWGDNVVHIAVFACMAVGWSLSIGALWPLLLGATAALGNLGSAGFVYWRMMRTKKDSGPLFTSVATVPGQTLARMLDAASRRDFIYLVLFLALFGKSNWFLVLAAAGAPIFFLLLLFLAARERFQTA